jgi:hypothetical protein
MSLPGIDICGDLRESLPIRHASINEATWHIPQQARIEEIIDCNSAGTPLAADWTEELLNLSGFDVVGASSFMEAASRYDHITAGDGLQRKPPHRGFRMISTAAGPIPGVS